MADLLGSNEWRFAAIQDFENRLRQLGPRADTSWLMEIAAASDWPVAGGWPPGAETLVVYALKRAVRQLPQSDFAGDAAERVRATFGWGPWVELFMVLELRDRVAVDDDVSLELWATRLLRLGRSRVSDPAPNLLLYLRWTVEAEQSLHAGVGWHLHPVVKGKHLGYRLLFDAKKTENELAWELHSRSKDTPWGDPARDVLSNRVSRDLYSASLKAVKRQSTLGQHPFKNWAARFVKPGKHTYYAYPCKSRPTPWCRERLDASQREALLRK